MSGVIVAPQVRNLAVLARSLETWLAPRLPQARNDGRDKSLSARFQPAP